MRTHRGARAAAELVVSGPMTRAKGPPSVTNTSSGVGSWAEFLFIFHCPTSIFADQTEVQNPEYDIVSLGRVWHCLVFVTRFERYMICVVNLLSSIQQPGFLESDPDCLAWTSHLALTCTNLIRGFLLAFCLWCVCVCL